MTVVWCEAEYADAAEAAGYERGSQAEARFVPEIKDWKQASRFLQEQEAGGLPLISPRDEIDSRTPEGLQRLRDYVYWSTHFASVLTDRIRRGQKAGKFVPRGLPKHRKYLIEQYLREGVSIRQINLLTGHARDTIRQIRRELDGERTD